MPLNGAPAQIQRIPVDQLQPNPWNRTVFDPAALEELVASIRHEGIREALIVRPLNTTPARYQIASGNRRWLAAKKAGLAAVPCLVEALSDEQVAEDNITMNIQREDIPPLELARMVKAYMDQFHKSQREVAGTFGKHESWVSTLQGYLELIPILKNFDASKFSWLTLRALKQLAPDLRKTVVAQLENGALKFEGIQKRCNQLKFGAASGKKHPTKATTMATFAPEADSYLEDKGFQFEWRGDRIWVSMYIDMERLGEKNLLVELHQSMLLWMSTHPQPRAKEEAGI